LNIGACSIACGEKYILGREKKVEKEDKHQVNLSSTTTFKYREEEG